MLPLLFTPQGAIPCKMILISLENLLKVTYTTLFFLLLSPHLGRPGLIERLYYVALCGIVAIEELAPLIAYTGKDNGLLRRYEFLPLMGVSVACAVGIVCGWMRFLRVMITE